MIRVLVADDHMIVRQGLRRVLAMADDIELAAEVANGRDLLKKIEIEQFDLLLTDMNMPGANGVELIQQVRELRPALPILVLSMHAEAQLVGRAIKAGATGYLTKDSEPEMILAAIRNCARGLHYIHPELGARLLFGESYADESALHERLSDRERQVFLLLAKGLGISQISEKLHISGKTVSTHKFRIMQKMGLSSMSELVRYALRNHMIEP
ncbi:MAG: response regulator transcription factor [Gammaproteobacteria bacterium]|nr:response regulator transcription factor [Gammaproteobacteria bacterium]